MYAPTTWSSGSSYSHLDYDTFAGTVNSLMVFSIGSGSSQHNPGLVTMGILKDMGWNLDNVPSTPTGVSASDGTFTDKVQVSWTTSAGATYYQVFRHTSNNSSSAISLTSSHPSSPYNDTSAVAGTTYYYWVKACNSVGCSSFSASDSGYRASEITPLFPPTGVAASDGAFTDKVRVLWGGSGNFDYKIFLPLILSGGAGSGLTSEAPYFEVFRNTSNSTSGATKLADHHPASPYDDTSAVAGTTYYYWVKACNSAGCSDFSASDSGWSLTSTIANGNFEAGRDESWAEYSSNVWDIIMLSSETPVDAHSGDWLAWLGGDDDDTSYVSQTISIPAETPYLHYWYWIASEDVCGYDVFRIKIGATTVDTYDLCYTFDTDTWVEGTLNLSAYAGSPVTLKFEVTTNSTLISNLFLDTISFEESAMTLADVLTHMRGDVSAATKAFYLNNQD